MKRLEEVDERVKLGGKPLLVPDLKLPRQIDVPEVPESVPGKLLGYSNPGCLGYILIFRAS